MASSPNCTALIRLVREKVDKNDEGLPNELILSIKNNNISVLAQEKVSLQSRSGHIRIIGTLDWNGDGFMDVLLAGDHEGCSYQSLFIGTEDGFDPADLPPDPCGC